MKMTNHLIMAVILAATCTPAWSGPDSKAVITENEPLPFYARVLTHIFPGNQDATWAGVSFLRPPSCVPENFNLLDFFDIPGAFSCEPMTVENFTIRKDPFLPPPFQFIVHGLGDVPVWLVDADDMEAAISDSVLTIGELEAIPSLVKGHATVYNEMVQSAPREPRQVTLTASGELDDGRTFHINGGGKNLLIDVK
jgi:hypothetical protein